MARLSEYKSEYAKLLVTYLAQGMLDCEIYDTLDICKNTFTRWRKEYPEFEEAYEQGLPKCEAWWVRKMKEKWLNGDDKGFKYCSLIMKSKFNYNESQINGVTNNTQINIQGNMNVLDSKSTNELISAVQDNVAFLKDNRVIDVDFISNDSQSDEQDS